MRKCLTLMAVIALVICSCAKEQPLRVEFRIAENEPSEGLTEITLAGTEESFYLHDEILMSNADIDTAFATSWQGKPAVDVIFTDAGRQEFAVITRDNLGKRMGIVVDGELLTAPVVRAQIRQGKAVINGDFTQKEAERIARGILLQ